jgi:hypothetical protein
MKPITLAEFKELLNNSELGIYAVVLMAREDLSNGRVDSAMARLKVDADKIRMHSLILYDFITNYK